MAHIESKPGWLKPTPPAWGGVLLACLSLLPYPFAIVVSLLGLLVFCGWQTYQHPRALLSLLYRWGFLGLSAWLVVSSILAFQPSEAYLQLAHFLPFFWIWAALVLYIQTIPQPWPYLCQWAVVLVLTAIPINLVGLGEYALKHWFPESGLAVFPGIDWLYIGDFSHPRVFSLFDYPNTLANYLVMILGLTMGLLLLPSGEQRLPGWPRWGRVVCLINLPLTLLCLYGSGSRNGFLVAAVVLLVSLIGVRTRGWVRSLGLAGFVLITVMTARFGIGGRELSWRWLTDDPRVDVWRLALQLIQERPLWGHGLGNYKLLYDGEAIGFDFIAHAHNLWLMLAAETGLPAAIALTIIVGLICYRAVRTLWSLSPRHSAYGILWAYCLCFFSSVLFSLLDVTIFEVRVNLLGWLSLAVLYCSPALSAIPPDTLDKLDSP